MRWLDELLHPDRKCQRVGHRMAEFKVRLFLYPPESSFRCVADRATEVWRQCRRCGHREEPEIINRRGLQGLKMSSDDWDRLREAGRLVAQ